jgi:aminopeptidase YwaD
MSLEKLLTVLTEELSGARAKDDVRRIAGFHRIQGSQGYSEAVELLQSSLGRLGISNEVCSYPADGSAESFSWTAPPAWNIRSGALQQIAPGEKVLARFSSNPHSIISQSAGGTAEGELIDVGEGTSKEDYEETNVAGKFVLATGRPRQVAPLAVSNGAVGVIVYPALSRALEHPDMVLYEGFWPNAETLQSTPLGFSISLREATALHAQMEIGPVRVRGIIDADYSVGSLQVINALIPGRKPNLREITLVAHLCHPRPSANDNASGSGLLLEIARTMVALSKCKSMLPLRSVRFLWVPELYGTLPWAIEHEDVISRILFALSLDMVGESQEKIGQPFRVGRVPGSTPSFLNTWFEPLLGRIANSTKTEDASGSHRPMHWEVTPPSGGSDHLVFSDSRYGIPAAIFGHKDPFHHTDLDDMEMVDATELKRVGILAALLAFLTDTAADDAPLLDSWMVQFAVGELHRAARVCHCGHRSSIPRLLGIALDIERDRARSFRAFLASVGVTWDEKRFVTLLKSTRDHLLASWGSFENSGFPAETLTKPTRRFDGPLSNNYFRSLPRVKRRFIAENFSGFQGALAQELINLSNGDRTINELALRLSLDFDRWIPEAVVADVIGILEEGGLIKT